MRKYQPIWLLLKAHQKAVIQADQSKHKTIIQGVKKEKWRDIEWKFLQDDRVYDLQWKSDSDILTFTLKDVTPITIGDL